MFYPIQVPRYLQVCSSIDHARALHLLEADPHPVFPSTQPLENTDSPVLVNPRPALKGIEAQLQAARDTGSSRYEYLISRATFCDQIGSVINCILKPLLVSEP